jgi:hypothetical protein
MYPRRLITNYRVDVICPSESSLAILVRFPLGEFPLAAPNDPTKNTPGIDAFSQHP